ncbi:MAG TPA: aldehyde dehydrogenase, partial [Desulfobacteraceae bacterium]|nr:aldehyde dehydrogenase [Desulfobacteraceae bacterium]
MNDLPDNRIVNEAVELAKAWQDRANELMTQQEKSIQDQMAKLLTHRSDKVVFAKLIDQCFRSKEPDRVADQVNLLFREFGIPVFFSTWEKDLVRLFMGVGRHVPKVSVPMMIEKIRKMSSRWVKFGEKDFLRAFLEKRKEQGVRININRIGEAVLGEKEALFRLDTYIDDLKQPDIESISVKISTIYSQIQPIAFDHTVDILTERLSRLYSTAKSNSFIRKDKTRAAKLVNLDMEKYLDLETTLA